MSCESASQPSLILASGSPRRRALMEQAGYVFEVVQAEEDTESAVDIDGLSPQDAVQVLARAKADSVESILKNRSDFADWKLVAADTVADLDGEILGKPVDRDDAKSMLKRLRGRRHHVHTGIVVRASNGESTIDVATTTLFMQAITDVQLEEYLSTLKWQGKAGAFGYQDGWDWLQVIQGSESNVVGLPMELLAQLL